MFVFLSSLWLSAYLCVLCVNAQFNAEAAEIRRDAETQQNVAGLSRV
jgi:hypothetical protein